VSPSTATGTVTFAVGSNTYGPVTLSGGVATYTVGPLSAGTYSATATYNGDDTYSSVTSASSSLSVAGPLSYSAPANIPQLTVGTQTTLHFGPPKAERPPISSHSPTRTPTRTCRLRLTSPTMATSSSGRLSPAVTTFRSRSGTPLALMWIMCRSPLLR
jgi:hypothetical protein